MTTWLGRLPSAKKHRRSSVVCSMLNVPSVDVCPLVVVGVDPSVVYRSV